MFNSQGYKVSKDFASCSARHNSNSKRLFQTYWPSSVWCRINVINVVKTPSATEDSNSGFTSENLVLYLYTNNKPVHIYCETSINMINIYMCRLLYPPIVAVFIYNIYIFKTISFLRKFMQWRKKKQSLWENDGWCWKCKRHVLG